nr:leucine-rich repeat domain-containing protein [uncultured Blautia sp.]
MKRKRLIALLTASFLVFNEAGYLSDRNVVLAQTDEGETAFAQTEIPEARDEEFEFVSEEQNAAEENIEAAEIPVFDSEQEEDSTSESLELPEMQEEESESFVSEETQDFQASEDMFGDGQTDSFVGNVAEEKVEENIQTVSSDFIIENGILTGYTGTEKNIVIPDGVIKIAGSAFENNTVISSVIFPEGLTEIGSYAFMGCSGLEGML